MVIKDDIIRDLRSLVDRVAELELQLAKAKKNSSKSRSSDNLPSAALSSLRRSGRAVGRKPSGSYDLSTDYFRFMFESGIEPTNHHREQQIRHCVIDCRPFLLETRPQGTRSDVGQRYHERMWTAIATCGKQNRSFFHFVHESIAAKINGKPAPSLLPN